MLNNNNSNKKGILYKKSILVITAGILLFGPIANSQKKPIPAPDRVISVLKKIKSGLKETRYQHATHVRPRQGKYFFDCSGMAAWVLKRSAPFALKAIGRPEGRRPLAKHFYNKIARIPKGKIRGPWYHVGQAYQIKPGDIIAWLRPKWFPSKSTGHVAFVLGLPQKNPGPVNGYVVRIADASKFKHENDTRDQETTGYGEGTLLIPTDSKGNPKGYGWFGSQTHPDWVVPTKLVIGRPLR